MSIVEQTKNSVDMFEIRVDMLEGRDALFDLRLPCQTIYSFRPKRQGGVYRGEEKERLDFLTEIARAIPYSYIDLEYDVPTDVFFEINKHSNTICSYHNYAGRINEEQLHMAFKKPSEIVKVAFVPVTVKEIFECIMTVPRLKKERNNVILIGMGGMGQWTRILGSFLNSPWTYVSVSHKYQTAEGQLTLNEALNIYRLHEIDLSFSVYGIIGKPLEHTISPIIHNFAFKEMGYQAVYVPFEIDSCHDFFNYINSFIPLRGLSVTIPFKQEIIPVMGMVDEEAWSIGSINTIRWQEGNWVGYNTDYNGFINPLLNVRNPEGLRVLLIGAGGAAAAVAFALKKHNARVTVTNRNFKRASELARKFKLDVIKWEDRHQFEYDILVNATPSGMLPDSESSPIELTNVEGKIIYDLVYNPIKTAMLKEAEEKGAIILNGLDMLIEQAVEQLNIWIGRSPSKHILKEAANAYLQSSSFDLF